jgi:uncharacterized protein (DUF779 family)
MARSPRVVPFLGDKLMPDQPSLRKVTATREAEALLAEIIADHGPVLFHQSGGCCDGSAPMCYPRDEFILGDHDVHLGTILGTPVYIDAAQYDAWQQPSLVLDAAPGRGGMFSLDSGRGRRFVTRTVACAAQQKA